MKRRVMNNEDRGKSNIHSIAMFSDTWEEFKNFKDYYDLSGDAALNALMFAWDSLYVSPEIQQYINDNKRGSSKELTREQKVKKAKIMSQRNKLELSGLMANKIDIKDDESKVAHFKENPIKLNKFI